MNSTAYEELFTRVEASELPAPEQELVLAAAEGPACLEAYLRGDASPAAPSAEDATPPAPAPAYLEEIAVEGFRGIAGRARLPLIPGPGLTVVAGRNGSGKSSFAEGLEVLLTGTTVRWAERTKVWQEGWRNLHHDGNAVVSARLRVDGDPEPFVLTRTWSPGAPLGTDQHPAVSGAASDWSELGWDTALARFRPLLSYDELGTMFSSRAADLYDALSAILGLGEFEAVAEVLRVERLTRAKTATSAKDQLTGLRARLTASDDPRAAGLLAALTGRSPSPDAVAAALDAGHEDPGVNASGTRTLARIELPAEAAISAAVTRVTAARATVDTLAQTDATQLGALAALLDQGLVVNRLRDDPGEPADCPLCGAEGTIDTGWVIRAEAQADDLRRRSAELRTATVELTSARAALTGLFDANIPRALTAAEAAGVPVADASEAWREWTAAITLAEGDGSQISDAATWVCECLGEARGRARELDDARAAAWRPLREQTSAWILIARQAVTDALLVTRLKRCEAWMGTLLDALRHDRLAPVIDGAQANWERLRHESNVALGDIGLHASGKQRYASFDVAIDGSQASALGVMSQGELSALAISIFLPRALLPGSPFGFVMIDDPVQSMDPAKVDGLARVLAHAAQERQVIVFSHDERLPEAIRRLDIDARIIEIKRETHSRVKVLAASTPSERYLEEARSIAKSDLPQRVIPVVVPGFCRSAIEAACETRIRRDMITRGVSHAEVDKEIGTLTSVTTWLAKALGYPVAQGRELREAVERLAGPGAWTAVRVSRAGAHEQIEQIDLSSLVRDTKLLVSKLEAP
jgi:energy-coupling factor transporter ATP-binding protein EcfA2